MDESGFSPNEISYTNLQHPLPCNCLDHHTNAVCYVLPTTILPIHRLPRALFEGKAMIAMTVGMTQQPAHCIVHFWRGPSKIFSGVLDFSSALRSSALPNLPCAHSNPKLPTLRLAVLKRRLSLLYRRCISRLGVYAATVYSIQYLLHIYRPTAVCRLQ